MGGDRKTQEWTPKKCGRYQRPGVASAWDGFGRLASSTTSMDGVARTLTYQYDAHGNRTLFGGNTGYGGGFIYDGLDRLTTALEGQTPVAQMSYDAAGRRFGMTLGYPAPSSSVGYGYDPAGRLTALTHDLAGTASDQALAFAYNPASQITTRTSANDAYAWTPPYDVARTYAVNGLNQYTAVGGTGAAAYSYDANGNLTGDGASTFVYDAENRLISARGAKTLDLAYDPLGRLWQTSGGSTGTTRLLYDGDRLAIEYDGAGNILGSYTYGAGTDEPLVQYETVPGGFRRLFYHADHQGSVVALADLAGNKVAVPRHEPVIDGTAFRRPAVA